MTKPWIDIIGIGEDGMQGLAPKALRALERAEILIGGDRHHDLSSSIVAERISWPSPFDALIGTIKSLKGKQLAILVTGDPLWYSVGARITKCITTEELTFHPQLSAFQWASARLGWSLADCETVTVHGRADSQILPHLAPNIRMLVLTQNAQTPAALAEMLVERGFGQSRLTVLAALGGPREQRFDGLASGWSHEVPDFHLLAIDCVADDDAKWYPRTGGLPDEAFVSDGQITKRDIRAMTLARLAPYPDAILWDIGAGCGSVSVEWMRAARGARSYAVESKPSRIDMIRQNMVALGAEKMVVVSKQAPQSLADLPQPDAVFIGGGLATAGVFEAAWSGLRAGGRLVANAVTLESESRLINLHEVHGGELIRLAVQRGEPVGQFRSWRAAMPVTQWTVIKIADAAA